MINFKDMMALLKYDNEFHDFAQEVLNDLFFPNTLDFETLRQYLVAKDDECGTDERVEELCKAWAELEFHFNAVKEWILANKHLARLYDGGQEKTFAERFNITQIATAHARTIENRIDSLANETLDSIQHCIENEEEFPICKLMKIKDEIASWEEKDKKLCLELRKTYEDAIKTLRGDEK